MNLEYMPDDKFNGWLEKMIERGNQCDICGTKTLHGEYSMVEGLPTYICFDHDEKEIQRYKEDIL